jgi:hypothetical protein
LPDAHHLESFQRPPLTLLEEAGRAVALHAKVAQAIAAPLLFRWMLRLGSP